MPTTDPRCIVLGVKFSPLWQESSDTFRQSDLTPWDQTGAELSNIPDYQRVPILT
jgi:hypothetical protein